MLVAFTDLVALAYVTHMYSTVFQDKDFASNLEYANPYIGLKELYESGKVESSEIAPILIRPRVSAQIFADEPNKLTPRGEHDYWDDTWGMLSPNERHLHVTPNVSATIYDDALRYSSSSSDQLCRYIPLFSSVLSTSAWKTVASSSPFRRSESHSKIMHHSR